MNPMLVAMLYPIAKNFIVDILRKKSADSSNTIDDKLVAAVEVALEGKDYHQVVDSVSREIERAADKVEAVKELVKKPAKKKKSKK
jgi:hypothetical protein